MKPITENRFKALEIGLFLFLAALLLGGSFAIHLLLPYFWSPLIVAGITTVVAIFAVKKLANMPTIPQVSDFTIS